MVKRFGSLDCIRDFSIRVLADEDPFEGCDHKFTLNSHKCNCKFATVGKGKKWVGKRVEERGREGGREKNE